MIVVANLLLTDIPVSSSEFFQALPGHWQAQLLATVGMAVLPPMLFENPNPKIVTYLPDGLHFRRCVVPMRIALTKLSRVQ